MDKDMISLDLVTPPKLYSQILESSSIETIMEFVHAETLVVFDLDNTLIEPTQQLGSVQWIDDLENKLVAAGKSVEEIDHLLRHVWCHVQPLIEVKPVDPQAVQFFKNLHAKDIRLVGLTARHPCEVSYTRQQLQTIDIAMNAHLFDTENEVDFSDFKTTVCYDNGILFCATLNPKSSVLRAFLNASTYKPKRIIFVDDKWEHIKDVEEFILSLEIDYIGIRFSGADDRVRSFNPAVAQLQYESLPQILSDEEAFNLVQMKHLNDLKKLSKTRLTPAIQH